VFKSGKKREQPRRPVTTVVNRPKPVYYGNDKPRTEDSVRARQVTEKKHVIWERLRLIPTLIALLAILVSVAYNTTLSTTPSINFSGDSSIYHSKTEYKNGIAKILDTSILNKSKLTFNTHKAQTDILKSYPELDAITIGLPVIGRRPTITMHVRQPALILTTKSNSFVLDTNGKVVAETKQVISSITSQLLTAQDQSGLELHVGDQALTIITIAFITNIKAQLTAKQLIVSGLTLPSGGNEIDIHIKDVPYFVKTDSSGDARVQIGDFLAAKESGISPYEYIDARVEEKVFYK
jgi:hypothetical protein